MVVKFTISYFSSKFLIFQGDSNERRRETQAAKSRKMSMQSSITMRGVCPICKLPVAFTSVDTWYRDHLLCPTCGSIPREWAIMKVIDSILPNWRDLSIHESSFIDRGPAKMMARECKRYTGSHFFPRSPRGEMVNGFVCQDIEAQTFPNESFDLVTSQDVMEHVFHPGRAHLEIWRTLKPGERISHRK